MIGEPRIALKPLAALCRRLALSLSAGVDVRTVWLRESQAASGASRRRFSHVSDRVAGGRSISEALAGTGNYFPDFFRKLVRVGEESGHLPEVCKQLADHYDHQLKLRRTIISSLIWPLIELSLALGVVGLLIWLMGAIPQLAKNKTDLLGFGLTGTQGLVIYLLILAMAAVGGVLVYRMVVRNLLRTASVQRFLVGIPQLGRALETLALARLTWAMYVTLHSGMELRSALRLSLASTQNAFYTRRVGAITAAIGRGEEVHEAFRATGIFPLGFLDAVRVGEESGQLVESMEILSRQYQEEARGAMQTLAVLLGVLVAALIASVIIFLIFRIFSFYTGAINDALNMR